MYKIKDEIEYREAVNEMDMMLDMEPDPGSDEGMALGALIDSVDEYEKRTRPRLIGWLCARCNRSYSPDVESCHVCSCAVSAPIHSAEKLNQQHYNDHLDHMITCDAFFKGRGC